MSQIRKLQSGGTPQKVGSLTIGGRRYEATPEMIQDLSRTLQNAGLYAAPIGGITSALQAGADIEYNPVNNTIRGLSGRMGVDERTERRRAEGKDRDFNTALQALAGYYYNASDNRSEILGDKIFLDFDDEGKYLPSGANNSRIRQRYQQIGEHFADEKNSKYKLGKFGDANIDALRALYKDPSAVNTRFEDILKRAETGGRSAITAEDLAFLKAFNIIEGGDKEGNGSGVKKGAKQDKAKWTNAGYGNLWDLLKDKATLNDDGSLSLNEGETDWGLGNYGNGNYYFNDSFYQNAANASNYNPFKGLTLFENRLYGIDNAKLRELLNREGGYNDLYRQGRFKEANDKVKTDWAPSELWEGTQLNASQYLPNFGKNIRFKTYRNDNGDQILEYVNLDKPTESNSPYTNYNVQYALLDAYGNLKPDQIGKDYIKAGGFYDAPLTSYVQVPTNHPDDPYRNYYYIDPTNFGRDPQGYRIYMPKDGNGDYIIEDPTQERNIRIPKEIAKILFTPERQYNIGALDAQGKKDWNDFLEAMSDPDKLKKNGILDWWRFWSDRRWNNFARQWGLSPQERDVIKNYIKSMSAQNRGVYRPSVISQKNGGVLKFVSGGTSGGSKEVRGVSERRTNNETNYNPKNAAGIADAKLFGGDGKNWTDDDTADLVALSGDLGALGLAFVPGANIASAAVGAAGSLARFKADLGRGTSGAGWNLALNLGMDAATLLPYMGGVAKGTKIVRAVKAVAPTLIKAASVFGLGTTFANSVSKIANGEKWTVRDVSNVVNGLTAATGLAKAGGLGKKGKTKKVFNDIEIKGKKSEGLDLSGKNYTIKKEDLGADFDGLSADLKQKRIEDVLLTKVKEGNPDASLEQVKKALNESVPTTHTGTDIVLTGKRDPNLGITAGKITLKGDKVAEIAKASNQKEALEDAVVETVKAETHNASLSKEDALKLVDMSQFNNQHWWKRKITPGKGWMKKKDNFNLGAEKTSKPDGEIEATGNWFHDWWYGVGAYQKAFNANFIKDGPNPYLQGKYTVTRTTKATGYKPKTIKLGKDKTIEFTAEEVQKIAKKEIDLYDIIKSKLGSSATPGEISKAMSKYRMQRNQRTYETETKTSGEKPIWIRPFSRINHTTTLGTTRGFVPRGMQPMEQTIQYDARTGFSMPHILPFQTLWSDANNQRNQYQTPAGFSPLYQPVYKKGGKIVKGQLGTPITTLADLEREENMANTGEYDTYIETSHSDWAPGADLSVENNWGITKSSKSTDFNLGGLNTLKGFNAGSLISAGLEAGKLFSALRGSKKQLNTWNDFKNNYKLPTAFQRGTNRFVSSGKGDVYRETAKRALDVPIVKMSDALKNYAMSRDRFGNYNKFMTQAALEDAQDRAKYRADIDATVRENEQFAYNAGEKARTEANQLGLMNAQQLGNYYAQNNKSLSNAADAAIARADKWTEQDAAYRTYNATGNLRSLISNYTDRYNNIADKNSQEAIKIKKLLDQYTSNYNDISMAMQRPGFYSLPTYKKGGKTKVEYSRDPFPEIMIESNKAVHRMAEKLSVETLRMLSKIKPLHVS